MSTHDSATCQEIVLNLNSVPLEKSHRQAPHASFPTVGGCGKYSKQMLVSSSLLLLLLLLFRVSRVNNHRSRLVVSFLPCCLHENKRQLNAAPVRSH